MKIIYILSGTSLYGGATKSILNLLSEVSKKDHQVLIICPNNHGIYEKLTSEPKKNINIECIKYTYDIYPKKKNLKDCILYIPRFIKRFILNRKAANRLYKIAKQFSPDLIHTNTSVNNIGFITSKKLSIPHIWHIREYGKLDFNMVVPCQSRKLSYPNNYIITITRDIARYKKLSNNPRHKTIYNGIVRINNFRKKSIWEKYFLYAGRVTEKKGIFDLLKAFYIYTKRTTNEIFQLKIAGEISTETREKIESYCKEYNISDKIDILGNVDDIGSLMYSAAATIVPSYFEGFGRVLPEAMANGSLTIGRDTGGTKEQYDNGLNITGIEIGFRFKSIDQLALNLQEITKHDKSYFYPMIDASQYVVKNLYSVESSSSCIVEFYKKILSNKNGY